MVGSKFSPRLESLDTRLCLSTAAAVDVIAIDVPDLGAEQSAQVDYKTGEEAGAAVDYFLVNNEMGGSGWDVKPGEEQGLLPAVRVEDGIGGELDEKGALVDYKAGESGWDVKPGEEQGAAVDYFYPTDQLGGPYVGGSGWDKQP